MTWILPAAPGLRAAPSQAAAPILDCPNAPPTTAIAKPTPAAIALTPLALAAAASAVCGCAKTDVAAINTATVAIKNKPNFLIVISSNLANRSNLGRNDFARIRYPPPLLQRRSSDTDYDKWI